MKHLRWLLLVVCLGGVACVDAGPERLGEDGEVCFEDVDCREPLICLRGLCQPEEIYLYSCQQICDYFQECGIQDRRACLGDCQDSFDAISVQRANDFVRCIFAQSCRELSLASARSCGQ